MRGGRKRRLESVIGWGLFHDAGASFTETGGSRMSRRTSLFARTGIATRLLVGFLALSLIPCMKFKPYAGRSSPSALAFSAPGSLLAFFSLEDWPNRSIKLSPVQSKILPAVRKRKKICPPISR